MQFPIRLSDQLKQHLRALRKARGLSQAQLGRLLGVGQTRVAEIEANPGLVSMDQLLRMFTALGAELVLDDKTGSVSATAGQAIPAGTRDQAGGPLGAPAHKGSW